MKMKIGPLCFWFLLLIPVWAYGADPAVGKLRAGECAKCHGTEGISGDQQIPNLAGQRYQYLYDQMLNFKIGLHRYGTMREKTRPMSLEEMEAVAAYYSGLSPFSGKGNALPETKGRLKLSTCETCHGTQGEGQPTHPRLAGQKSGYLFSQLKAFRTGARNHPVMTLFVEGLTDDDIRAISDYYSNLK
jgi:cytochrome c553